MAPDQTQRLFARLGTALRFSALIALTLVCAPSGAVDELRTGEIATQLSDGSLLITGGVNALGQPTGEAYVLNVGRRLPLANRFQEARTGHTATVMPDGKVLVHGGTVAGGAFARRTELIDPQTRSVSAVGSLDLLPRAHHTTSVLTDGTIVVAGGIGVDGFPLFDVELINGFTRQPYPTRSSLLAARYRHAALLLPTGQLLISGGQDRIGAVATGEALDASTQEFAPIAAGQMAALLLQVAKSEPARLAGSIPINDARDVDRGASISLRFSNSISIAGSRAAKISLRTVAGVVPVAVTFTERGRLLFINPQQSLATGELHTVTVEGLIDDSGSAVAPFELKFTTARAPTSSGPQDSTDPSKAPPPGAPPSPSATVSPATSSAAMTSTGAARVPSKTDLTQVKKTVRLPLFFEMNVGQDHPEVKARTLGAGLGVFLTARSVVFKLPTERRAGPDQIVRAAAARAQSRGRTGLLQAETEPTPPASDVLSMNFVGGKADPIVVPEQPFAGKTHYLRTDGKAGHRNVAHYGRIRYLDVYAGIDKVHYGVEGKLEHDWIVKPGADPAQIVAEFEGASALDLQPTGDLVVKAANSSLTVRKPYAYQVVAGRKTEIAATFKVIGTNRVTFALGSYDKTRELVIDPVVEYLSYLAVTTSSNPIIGLAAAADGSLFVLTVSQGGFPTRNDLAPTGGAPPSPDQQFFILKLNRSGTAFDWATTVVGLQFNNFKHGLVVDALGRVTFTALAGSLGWSDPSRSADCLPADTVPSGARTCGRLVRLTADGAALDVFVRLPHGVGIDAAGTYTRNITPTVALGPTGDIFAVAPFLQDFFVTAPALPPLQAAVVTQTGGEGVVTGCGIFRYLSDGSGPVYSAYIRNCTQPSIAVDSGNSVHIAYGVNGTRIDGPTAPIVSRYTTDTWGRIARIDTAGTSFIYNTDLVADVVVPAPAVGRYTYTPNGVAIDASGNLNVVGTLASRIDPAGNLIHSLDPFAVTAPSAGCSGFLLNANATPRFESMAFGPGGAGYLIGTATWPQASECGTPSGWIVKTTSTPNRFEISDVKYFGASRSFYLVEAATADPAGNIYIGGYSFATPPAIGVPPRSPLPGQPFYPSGPFLAKLSEVPVVVTEPNPSIVNAPVSLRLEAPDSGWTGTVLFKRNGVTLGTASISGGIATLVRSDFTAAGTYTITAEYSGDGMHAPATLTGQHVVQTNVFRTFVNLTNIPVYPDECQDITLRATIPSAAGPLTGPIIFRHEYRELGRVVPNASRVADLNIGRWPLPQDSWWFNAYYAGDSLHTEGAVGKVGVQIQAQNNVATLTQPLNNARFSFPSTVPITVAYTHTCLVPTSVRLFANNVLVKEVPGTASPINFDWTPAFEGAFVLRATLIMPNGRQPFTPNVTVRVINGTYSDVQTSFLHTDAAGSPVAATDAAGTRIWTQEYDPFGLRVSPQPAALGNRQWFHGKAQDAETGFQYFGARYYDPLTGRFMGIDAAGVKDDNIHSFNRYSFANNNPYRFTDPDGNSPIDVLFLAYDVAKLGVAIYSGVGVGAAVADVGLSVVGVISPFPGTGQVLKAVRTVDRVADVGRTVERAAEASRAADKVVDSKRVADTLRPGPFAKESIPAHPGRPTAPEQRQINALMGKHGCHTCGTKDAGTKSGNAIADHQPAQALDHPKVFLPHCNHCKARQGGQVLQELRRRAAEPQ